MMLARWPRQHPYLSNLLVIASFTQCYDMCIALLQGTADFVNSHRHAMYYTRSQIIHRE